MYSDDGGPHIIDSLFQHCVEAAGWSVAKDQAHFSLQWLHGVTKIIQSIMPDKLFLSHLVTQASEKFSCALHGEAIQKVVSFKKPQNSGSLSFSQRLLGFVLHLESGKILASPLRCCLLLGDQLLSLPRPSARCGKGRKFATFSPPFVL